MTVRGKLAPGRKRLKIRTATRKANDARPIRLKLSLAGKTLRKAKAGVEAGGQARAKLVAVAADAQRSPKVLRTLPLEQGRAPDSRS